MSVDIKAAKFKINKLTPDEWSQLDQQVNDVDGYEDNNTEEGNLGIILHALGLSEEREAEHETTLELLEYYNFCGTPANILLALTIRQPHWFDQELAALEAEQASQ